VPDTRRGSGLAGRTMLRPNGDARRVVASRAAKRGRFESANRRQEPMTGETSRSRESGPLRRSLTSEATSSRSSLASPRPILSGVKAPWEHHANPAAEHLLDAAPIPAERAGEVSRRWRIGFTVRLRIGRRLEGRQLIRNR